MMWEAAGVERSAPCPTITGRAGGRRHAQDHLGRAVVEVAPVPAQDERLALHAADAVEDRLDVILEVVRAHEDIGLLAQAGGAGLLSVDGRRGDGQPFHVSSPSASFRSHGRRRPREPRIVSPVLRRERQAPPPVRIFADRAGQVRLVGDIENVLDLQRDEP
jgi:hypothetical protein